MAQLLNFKEALSQRRLAQEQEIAELERQIVELELQAGELRKKRNQLERTYLGEMGHSMKQVQRRADKLKW